MADQADGDGMMLQLTPAMTERVQKPDMPNCAGTGVAACHAGTHKAAD